MLKLGDKTISKLYLGDKAIAKAYLGDRLVFQAGKPIFLEYIEFDGNSWIDTGLFANSNTRVETTFYTTVKNTGFYGAYAGSRMFSAYINGNWRIDSTETGIKYTEGTLVNSKQDKNGVVINGVLKEYISTPTEFIGNRQMFLGWVNGAPTSWVKFKGKLYKFQVYENNILVGDFKPCINPNGVVCFYDTVTKKYFYNQGTGQFKAGGKFVKSILFDGASWIDTGIIQQTCDVECRIRFEETGTRQLMGFGLETSSYWGAGASGTFDYFPNTNALDMSDVVLRFNTDDPTAPTLAITVDGKSVKMTGSKVVNFTYKLGGVSLGGSVLYYPMTGEVWSNKFYIAGELIQDLRPFVDENEVACFYDMVTGTKFYNQGTGTLGYTEE